MKNKLHKYIQDAELDMANPRFGNAQKASIGIALALARYKLQEILDEEHIIRQIKSSQQADARKTGR